METVDFDALFQRVSEGLVALTYDGCSYRKLDEQDFENRLERVAELMKRATLMLDDQALCGDDWYSDVCRQCGGHGVVTGDGFCEECL